MTPRDITEHAAFIMGYLDALKPDDRLAVWAEVMAQMWQPIAMPRRPCNQTGGTWMTERLTDAEINRTIEMAEARAVFASGDHAEMFAHCAAAMVQLQADNAAMITDNAMLRERGPIDWRDGPPGDDFGGVFGAPCLMRLSDGKFVLAAGVKGGWIDPAGFPVWQDILAHCPVTS